MACTYMTVHVYLFLSLCDNVASTYLSSTCRKFKNMSYACHWKEQDLSFNLVPKSFIYILFDKVIAENVSMIFMNSRHEFRKKMGVK